MADRQRVAALDALEAKHREAIDRVMRQVSLQCSCRPRVTVRFECGLQALSDREASLRKVLDEKVRVRVVVIFTRFTGHATLRQSAAVAAVEAHHRGAIDSLRLTLEQRVEAANARVCCPAEGELVALFILRFQADAQITAATAAAEAAKEQGIAGARREAEELTRSTIADADRCRGRRGG